eukprot:13842818-Ditylum_brightwellii.AAC.1
MLPFSSPSLQERTTPCVTERGASGFGSTGTSPDAARRDTSNIEKDHATQLQRPSEPPSSRVPTAGTSTINKDVESEFDDMDGDFNFWDEMDEAP